MLDPRYARHNEFVGDEGRPRLSTRPLALLRLAAKSWAKAWVYRCLVLVVVLSIAYLLVVDSGKVLQHT